MTAVRPSPEYLDAREAQLRQDLVALEYADCFAASGPRRRRVNEELAQIAVWRREIADEAARGRYLPLRPVEAS